VVSINPVLLLVQLGTFLVAVFLLWRFLWKPLAKFMEARRYAIENDIESARKGRESAEQLQAQIDQRLAEIDTEARRMLQLASDESKRTREQILQEAQAESRRLLDNAGRQIAEERVRAIRDLRAETVALSLLIAEKALKQSVDAQVQHRLVDEFVAELKLGES
jgi:F-type H+-transporting ATPase subunit b